MIPREERMRTRCLFFFFTGTPFVVDLSLGVLDSDLYTAAMSLRFD